MNETVAIQKQIGALLRARNYLLNQTPSDMVALAQVSEEIMALNQQQSASEDAAPQFLSTTQENDLVAAIQSLDDAISHSATATNILTNVTALIGAV